MKDIQTIVGLFIVLVIIISMGLQFSGKKEGFHNEYNTGSKLDYKPVTKIKNGDKDGSTRYLGLGYLGVAKEPETMTVRNVFDGLPSHY